ncbi:MAG: Nramp family divalent metal transporter [Bacteroidota bacterium]
MRSFLKKIGPGMLFAGAAIGVSHLVQSTRAGADFGYGLLWALLLAHLFKYPFFQYAPRYAMATGESLLDGYKKMGKGILILYLIITFATMFTIQTAVTVVTAGIATRLFGVTDDVVTWSIVITIVCFTILLIGKYRLLDRLMKVIIIILTVSTLITVAAAITNATEPQNLRQILPENAVEIGFLIAFMGWMPAPLDISVWHSLWTLEKKKTAQQYTTKGALLDFNVGFFSTVFLGILFLSLGALVMYNSGEVFSDNASAFSGQLIQLYTNNLGPWAYIIIAVAAFTTMFSTTITTLDASPRAMAHTTGLLFKSLRRNTHIIWMLILVAGTLVILGFFRSGMRTLVDIATILSFVTAPFYAIINYRLLCSRHTPEAWRPSKGMRILSWAGILFLMGFSFWYLSTFL